MISQNTISKVFDAIRIEEIIGDFVQLKKSGSNFKGLSPFTDERSPSFMVSPVKQIWKDFSSGKGGNTISFLMEHEHFSYPDAIKYLAKKYGIEIEETQQNEVEKQKASVKESLFILNDFASSYFENNLQQTDIGLSIGKGYFTERGFSDETIKKFRLGYSLDQWQAFTDHAIHNGYAIGSLEKSGLTIVKENKNFDRFKGRVMFPILSMSGRVLGFGGRILKQDKKAAKYINSPESIIYNKSKVLYGIYHAKQHIAKSDNCYLVEGYTDVIQLYQSGIKNVVSSSGTSLTEGQIRLINRLTKNITVLYDGDSAGIRAAMRGIDIILEQDLNVRVCTFPEGEDPDSFAKNHTQEEIERFFDENTEDFIRFKSKILLTDIQKDPALQADAIRSVVLSISKIPNPIKEELYIRECANLFNVSEEVLFSTLAQIKKRAFTEAKKKKATTQPSFEIIKDKEKASTKINVQHLLERKILEILLLYGKKKATFEDEILKEEPDSEELVMEKIKHESKVYEKIYMELQEDEIEFTEPHFTKIYDLIIQAHINEEDITRSDSLNKLPIELSNIITSLLMEDEKYKLDDWERNQIFPTQKEQKIVQLVTQTILNLRCRLIDQKILDFQTKLQMNQNNSEVLEQVSDYIGLKILLSRKLGRVAG